MSFHTDIRRMLSYLGLIVLLQFSSLTRAASTDIANAPLFTSSVSSVKSNILFILDNSGSMGWDYLPDDAAQSGSGKYGHYAAQCNGVQYNPALTYRVPVKYDGTSYAAASFSAAKTNGYSATSSTSNLANRYYYRYTGAETAMSYTYTSAGVVTSSTFYRECNSAEAALPGSAVFTKVILTSGSAEAQNYANWFSYYSDRILMMKTSVGLAFSAVDAKYRIGFNVISNPSVSGSNFLDVKDFDATQKQSFYAKLYAATPGSSTPLRGALSRAGQYFANKAPGQAVDPMQYSCQKNFSILSTDGYWNTNDEISSGTRYGPYQLNNSTAVGQQDGAGTERPMYDGATQKTTTTYRWNVTAVTAVATATPKTSVTTSTTTSTTSTAVNAQSRTSYTLGTLTVEKSNNLLSRCAALSGSNCTITVTTSSNHGFSTGDTVAISAAAPAVYNGAFTITRISNSQFSYVLTGLAARPANDSAAGKSTKGSCPNNQGVLAAQLQTRDKLLGSTLSTVTTTTQTDIFTSTTTTTAVTPNTRVVVVIDGLAASDTTTAGASTSTSTTATATTPGLPATVTTTGTVNGVTSYTAWVNSGAAASSCAAALPSPNPSTAVDAGAPASLAPVVVNTPAVVVGPSVTNGTAAVSTVGPILTDGTVTTSVVVGAVTGGSTDSLADVAMYYYVTDLRDAALANCTGALGTSVCANNVAGGGRDSATYQHMTSFTLGLGNSGTLKYDPKYLSQKSGDYFDISQGSKNWPTPVATTSSGSPENIDDLWHAAVDGRGQYFSAKEPQSLSQGLSDALDAIKSITGAASAAATSSLQPVSGNNDIYVAQFTSQKWTGDLLAYKIDPTTGTVSATTTWSAQARLDAATPSARTIKYAKSGALRAFTYANLTADGLQTRFDSFCSKTGAGGTAAPTQCADLGASDLTLANSGANLVDYLRGTQTYSVYRSREHVLGDVINASPLFVGKPGFKYVENNYSGFSSASTRADVIYVAANDGMLHAIERSTGDEKWAFIPSLVMPTMYKLADANYPNNHQFMVDGAPVMGDIYTGGAWKTILVGGLNAGGRGYYALDVTDPESPSLLWEFSETDLGYSFGNPVIAKKADGTWVVMFTSGYNNVTPGDGNGHLYVLNANTGVQLLKLDTLAAGAPVGTVATPSGLAKINAYIASDADNTAQAVYGGDLLGNVWRFDIGSSIKPYLSALRLAELKVAGKAQPVTTKPALAEVNYLGSKYRVIYVATGKYLGTTDLVSTDTQTIYALKDEWAETGLGDVRAGSSMVVQTGTAGTSATLGNIVTGTGAPVNWSTKSGWYLDLIGAGERVSVNPNLVLNTLYVGSNVPSNDACTVGGTSWLYQLDIGSGKAQGVAVPNVLIMGMTTVQLPDATTETILTRSDGTLGVDHQPPPTSAGVLRRTSWRVLQ